MATTRRRSDPTIGLLLDHLDRAYRGRSWHGTALRGTLRGVAPNLAVWRPPSANNSIWQLLLHAAYWKYAIRRKLTGDDRGSFPRVPANFPDLPAPADPAAWKRDLQLLEEQHRLLRSAVERLDARTLPTKHGSWRVIDYVLGAASHDLYHAGQINLLKRLHGTARTAR